MSSTVRRPAAPADTGQTKIRGRQGGVGGERSRGGQEPLTFHLNSRKFSPEQEVMSLGLPLLIRGAVELEVRGSEGGATV